MRSLRFIRRHPIALLGVFALAFVVWLWRDSLPVGQPDSPELRDTQLIAIQAPPPGEIPPSVAEKAKPSAQGTAQALTKLKPGMTRAEVEELVGVPAPDNIRPVTVVDGKVTYQTAYEADLGPPATIRPITLLRSHPAPLTPAAKGRTLVTLEYDATKPGHPLLGIHYADPLF